ncbi:MAG: hypothetical protein K6C37_06725 [Bacteroidales bacterium]|nr:hypothetical protein [Bacteroidales bacterium]
MTKAEERALEAYPKDLQQLITFDHSVEWADANARDRRIYLQGYAQGEADQKEQMIKEALKGKIRRFGFHNTVFLDESTSPDLLDSFNQGDRVRIIIVKEDRK